MDQKVANSTESGTADLFVASGPTRPLRLSWRRLLATTAGMIAAVAGACYAIDYWRDGRFLESTDDAYLAADAVTISAHVSGYIAELFVTDNESVAPGQRLARIDDRDYRTALEDAEAALRSSGADIRNLDAQATRQTSLVAQDEADLKAAQAAAVLADQDLQRAQNLVRSGSGTVKAAQQSEADIREKQASIAHARASLDAARQQIDVLKAQRDMAVAREAADRARLQQARINLSYTSLVAPVAGAVGDRTLRVGRYVQPGAPLMQIVPLGRDIYILANFKETQLAQMFRGERVAVSIDMFPGHVFEGRVDSLAPGSGAQFALLPPENATGNFTKIVQRVPVKIRFTRDNDPLLDQLRPGLSVIVSVDTRTKPVGSATTLAMPVVPRAHAAPEAKR